jgi:hypothetical protein
VSRKTERGPDMNGVLINHVTNVSDVVDFWQITPQIHGLSPGTDSYRMQRIEICVEIWIKIE